MSQTDESRVLDALWDDDGLFDQVSREIDYAISKHGFAGTPANHDVPREVAFVILAEEVGEVARAICDTDYDNLRQELLQVAAVALMMIIGEDS